MCTLARRGFILALISLLVWLPSAWSLTIDGFDGDGSVESAVLNSEQFQAISTGAAIGGTRMLYAVQLGGTGSIRLVTSASALRHSQDSGVSGRSRVVWDGNTDTGFVDYDGLGGINLVQDGGDAVRLQGVSFDYPGNSPIDVKLRLYDASDSFGDKYAEITTTLSSFLDNVTIDLPLSGFVHHGAGPDMNFHNIGAITLDILGASPNVDLTIGRIGTNGQCDLVPNEQGRVIDDCGVCGGSNQNMDSCGVCYGNNEAMDSCGVCFGENQSLDDCGICGGNNQSMDQCGICGGNNTSCLDCAGTPNGTAQIDPCGICGGNGSACADCNGTPNGTAVLDACGVCGGSAINPDLCNGSCILVTATEEVLAFEKRLLTQARTLRTRYKDDVRRAKTNKCGIDVKGMSTEFNSSFERIRSNSRKIFTTGVEVCSDSCVTVSYAEEVEALQPEFSIMERNTRRLANLVKRCYKRKKNNRVGSGVGVSGTITDVRSGLNRLIEDCRNRQVCPPGH